MMTTLRLIAAALTATASLACGTCAAAPDAQQCPARLAVIQRLDGPSPDGWKNYDTKRTYPLAGVRFWSGSPDRMATLMPNGSRSEGKQDVEIWSLAESDDDYWISCDYGNTSVMIARPLGKHAQTCIARYSRRPAVIRGWRCTPAT